MAGSKWDKGKIIARTSLLELFIFRCCATYFSFIRNALLTNYFLAEVSEDCFSN